MGRGQGGEVWGAFLFKDNWCSALTSSDEDVSNLKSLSSVGTSSFLPHLLAQIVHSVGFRWEDMGVDGRESGRLISSSHSSPGLACTGKPSLVRNFLAQEIK